MSLAQHLYDRWHGQYDGPESATIEEFATVDMCHMSDDEWTEAVAGAEAIQAKAEGRTIHDSGWSIECQKCGDEYHALDLTLGICEGCRNEREGLCWCGRRVYDGYGQCDRCAAEERADVLFHADR